MTTVQARRFVLVSMVVVAATVAAARTLDQRQIPRARGFVAVVLVGVVLSFVADFSPRLAASFAGLVLTATLLTSGADVFNSVSPTLGRLRQ